MSPVLESDPLIEFYKKLGANIRSARYFANPNKSQQELARAIGVNRNTISNWERGFVKNRNNQIKTINIGLLYIFLIAIYLDLDVSFFLRGLPFEDLHKYLISKGSSKLSKKRLKQFTVLLK